jgi:nitroreductase
MEINELEKLLKSRRSIRRWKKDEVPEELLKKAVELATWAPNGGNFQGWHFIAVEKKEMIKKMADAVQAVADKIAAWPEAQTWKEEVERYLKNASFFKEAPVCIAVFISRYQSVADKILISRESFDPEAKQILEFRRSAATAIQSAAAAVTTMLLSFHQMGLGAVWMAAPLQAKKKIETLLNVPAEMDLVALVAVGYPAESPIKDRKPVDQVLEFVK